MYDPASRITVDGVPGLLASGLVGCAGASRFQHDDYASLACSGSVHEWFPDLAAPGLPLGALIGVVGSGAGSGRVLWIGRGCWPHPHALVLRGGDAEDRTLLERSLFVDPPSHAERVWVSEVALRSPAVRVVVADGAGLTMAESRRLQLAAASGRSVGLLVRPACERGALSVAKTRWLVSPLPTANTDDQRQGWTLELLRCKGVRPATLGSARRWVVRRDHATGETHTEPKGDGRLADGVVGGPRPPARARIA